LVLISFAGHAQVPAQTVPDFTFFKLNKTPFETRDLSRGEKLLFIFFDTECEHCQRAVTYLGAHYGECKNAAIYLITLDGQEKIARFMTKYGVGLKDKKNVTLLQDKQYQFITRFQPRKYPSMFLYSPDKKLMAYEDNDESVFRILRLLKEDAK
jgi:peroxiredoxin